MKLIERKKYLKRLINVLGTPDIKVITGVRRSGKSKLLEAFMLYITTHFPKSNIIHINFNLLEFEMLQNYHALYDYIVSKYIPEMDNMLFIDEVQMCEGFEKAINSLHASGKYDIYITGSNAFLLSSDLATLFTGRTFEIEVFPFSLAEYMEYHDTDDVSTAYNNYFKYGGMSGSYLYKTKEDKYDYLDDIFNTLIIRDIRQKYNIRSPQLMDRIVDFLMDNVGNLSSARSISDSLTSNQDKLNHKTVGKYLGFLCNAFAFYKVRRYDLHGKKYLATNDKYYLCDHAFRYARLGTKNLDYGHVLENIVAIDLLRRGYELYIGVLYKKEIDFVALKRDKKIYIQVSDDITNPKTFAREASPLLAIKDAYPKVIISHTQHENYSYEGIQIIDISEWLLMDEL